MGNTITLAVTYIGCTLLQLNSLAYPAINYRYQYHHRNIASWYINEHNPDGSWWQHVDEVCANVLQTTGKSHLKIFASQYNRYSKSAHFGSSVESIAWGHSRGWTRYDWEDKVLYCPSCTGLRVGLYVRHEYQIWGFMHNRSWGLKCSVYVAK